MSRLHRIICAFRHYLRLHFANPKLSKCMLVSLLLIITTAGPIARAQHDLWKNKTLSTQAGLSIGLKELLSGTNCPER